jgi:hypothetical protein
MFVRLKSLTFHQFDMHYLGKGPSKYKLDNMKPEFLCHLERESTVQDPLGERKSQLWLYVPSQILG